MVEIRKHRRDIEIPDPDSPEYSVYKNSWDFDVRGVPDRGAGIVAGRGWWRISKRMTPQIGFSIWIDGMRWRFWLSPKSVLSHPDARLFEKVLYRESLLMQQDTGIAPDMGEEPPELPAPNFKEADEKRGRRPPDSLRDEGDAEEVDPSGDQDERSGS